MGPASNLGYPKLLCYGSLVHYFTPHQNHPKPTIPGLQVARPVEGDTSRVTFSCCEGFTRSTSSPGAMVIGPSRVDNLGWLSHPGPRGPCLGKSFGENIFGGFLSHGTPKSSKSWMIILVLKPMVTWGSPILRTPPDGFKGPEL